MTPTHGREQIMTTTPDGTEIWHRFELPDGRALTPGTEFTATTGTGRERLVFVHSTGNFVWACPVENPHGHPTISVLAHQISIVHRTRKATP